MRLGANPFWDGRVLANERATLLAAFPQKNELAELEMGDEKLKRFAMPVMLEPDVAKDVVNTLTDVNNVIARDLLAFTQTPEAGDLWPDVQIVKFTTSCVDFLRDPSHKWSEVLQNNLGGVWTPEKGDLDHGFVGFLQYSPGNFYRDA